MRTFWDEVARSSTAYVRLVLSRDNLYLGNLLVGSYSSCALNGPPGWTYYSSDHLGTPRLVTDRNGYTLDSRKYWPYGDEAAGTLPSSSQRLRLAAMERDTEASRTTITHAQSISTWAASSARISSRAGSQTRFIHFLVRTSSGYTRSGFAAKTLPYSHIYICRPTTGSRADS